MTCPSMRSSSRRNGSLWRVTGWLLLASVTIATWWIPSVQALDAKLYGVNYDYRQGADWSPTKCKGVGTIRRELQLLSTITPRLRVYSLSDCNVRPILTTAKSLNMTVWLGMWVGNHTAGGAKVFAKEVATLQRLINDKLVDDKLVVGINVGSEVLYRGDATPEELLNMMAQVKQVLTNSTLNIPLSITDTMKIADDDNAKVLDAVDVVTVNLFPFWGKIDLNDSMSTLQDNMGELANKTNKKIIITETGWSTQGRDVRASIASRESAAKYLSDFFALASEKQWAYYYFSGFDALYRAEQDTKGGSNPTEPYFGIFDSNGKMKRAFINLTISNGSYPYGRVDSELPTLPPVQATEYDNGTKPGSSKKSSTNSPHEGSHHYARLAVVLFLSLVLLYQSLW